MENWNSANTVLHYGKDGALSGPDKEHAETSMRLRLGLLGEVVGARHGAKRTRSLGP
ncbi:hypothetical protein ACFT8P_33775 [Streptomyces sp. NPDC057101]|uniref:hypothetical protein n=1 Tax=Streptomyces sp. NPDC057101 TaxID=3346020 RepID=UPI00362F2843